MKKINGFFRKSFLLGLILILSAGWLIQRIGRIIRPAQDSSAQAACWDVSSASAAAASGDGPGCGNAATSSSSSSSGGSTCVCTCGCTCGCY